MYLLLRFLSLRDDTECVGWLCFQWNKDLRCLWVPWQWCGDTSNGKLCCDSWENEDEERRFLVGVPSHASSYFTRHGGVEVRHEGGGMCGPLSDAWRFFFSSLLNFDLTSIILVCHSSFSLQGSSLSVTESLKRKKISAFLFYQIVSEAIEVMEAILLWYVDLTETTLSILEKKKKNCKIPPSWTLAQSIMPK